MKFKNTFRPHSGAGAFFFSILLWGVGVGCFAAAMNNFLSGIYQMDSVERGWLEFFRELPGLALVFLLAILHKVSDWKVIRLGTMISMAGAALLLIPADKLSVTVFIMLWSLGEHLVMPIRSAVAMRVANPGCEGRSLGLLTGVMNFGSVAGSLLVAVIFYAGTVYFVQSEAVLFNVLWGVIIFLMLASTISTFTKDAPREPTRRPRLYFNRKFGKYYALELFYGARKQIFLTFAPYVLIKEYSFTTAGMALLLGICAFINIFAAPAIGRLTDKWGYRNTMIWDTVVLCFVCLAYGFAGKIFALQIAACVVCVNFVLDAVISTTALATNIYVKTLAHDRDELTATLATGISINHLISILTAPLGGWIWSKFGVEYLFVFASVMAIGNTAFAMTIPKGIKQSEEKIR